MEPLMTPLMAHSVLRNSKTGVKECSLLAQNTNKNLNVQNYTSDFRSKFENLKKSKNSKKFELKNLKKLNSKICKFEK